MAAEVETWAEDPAPVQVGGAVAEETPCFQGQIPNRAARVLLAKVLRAGREAQMPLLMWAAEGAAAQAALGEMAQHSLQVMVELVKHRTLQERQLAEAAAGPGTTARLLVGAVTAELQEQQTRAAVAEGSAMVAAPA